MVTFWEIVTNIIWATYDFGCEIIKTNPKHRSEDIEKSRCLECKVDKIVKKRARERRSERKKTQQKHCADEVAFEFKI